MILYVMNVVTSTFVGSIAEFAGPIEFSQRTMDQKTNNQVLNANAWSTCAVRSNLHSSCTLRHLITSLNRLWSLFPPLFEVTDM